jgi:hypothetical protein
VEFLGGFMADPVYLDRAATVNTLPNGDQRNKYSAIFDAFERVYGRSPTQDELNQVSPAFETTNQPHVTNVSQGNALVSQMHTAADNTPDKLYAKQQEEYKKNAPQHYDSVKNLFQAQLGRAPSQEELDHFGSLLASGTTDQYQLQQFLQQQPEYQQTQNKNFQAGLSDQLSGYDKQYFQNSILPSLQESYAKQGRSFDSSAFQAAATNSAQQQNTQRQQFLANLSAQQYGNTQANAYADYARQVANQQALTNSGVNAQYSGMQNALNRSNELMDFNTQSQIYNQYLAKYGKRNNGLGSAIGGVIGGGIGAYFGGPTGAMAGSQMGSGLGQAGQNAFGGSY